jgi:hypothetical protein
MLHVLLMLVQLRTIIESVLRVKFKPLVLLYLKRYLMAPGFACMRRSIPQHGQKNIALLSDFHFNSKD